MLKNTYTRGVRLSVFTLFALSVNGFAFGDDIKITEIIERNTDSNNANTLYYNVAVLNTAGWQQSDVERAIDETKMIYAQCDIRLHARSIRWIDTPGAYLNLAESKQADIIRQLPASRPLVVFIQQTDDGYNAYSYLFSAPLTSRGSAWLTRKSNRACTGTLLAHELGHILLNSEKHADNTDNLMAYTCTHSNIQGTKPNTALTPQQCAKLQNARSLIEQANK